jgi:hypothetical protein
MARRGGRKGPRARYATLRNTIEGLNGYAKDPAHEALAAAGRRRVRGYPPIMTAPGADLGGITHRDLDVRGLRMHVAEAGSGPLVLLLHGFPESWYSWRHQLAAAGFHAAT